MKVNNPSGATDSPKVIIYHLGTTIFIADFINRKVKYKLSKGFTLNKPELAAEDKLIHKDYDEKHNLLGAFTFENGYIKGTYTNNKNKKVFHFRQIDMEP